MQFRRMPWCALRGLFLVALIVGGSLTGLATPPGNDLCQGAIVVPAGGPFPYLTAIVTNVTEATGSGDPSLPPTCGVPPEVLTSGGIWYAFTPEVSGLYHLSVSDDTATTVIDTVMAVYRSSSGCAGPFTSVACNDDEGARTSALALNLTANTAYYVIVWAAWSDNSPTAQVQLRVSRPAVPANDTCAGAEDIPGVPGFAYLTQITDSSLATTNGDPPQPSCTTNRFAGSVWYRFTPTLSRTYVVSTCDDTSTTVYDTMLAIYTAPSGNCAGPFTLVACSDIKNERAVITNMFSAGTTYFIVAGDASQDGVTVGQTLIQLRIFQPRGPQTDIASSVTPTSAVLNAIVPNFNTAQVKAWFEWGTTNYDHVTPIQSIITGTNDLAVSAFISSLTTNWYGFRLVISNCFGLARSPTTTFFWTDFTPTLFPTPHPDGGAVYFWFNGTPGQQYTVLSSTTFSNWTETGRATDLRNGAFEFRDSTFPVTPARFYKVRSP